MRPPVSRGAGPRLVDAGLAVMLVCVPVTISGAQAGLAIALAGAVIALLRGRRFPRTALDEPILAFLGVTLLSALISADPARSLRQFLSAWTILALYLVVGWLREPARLDRFLGLLLAPAVAIGVYGIAQHFTGWNLLQSGGGGPLHTLVLGGRTVFFPRGGFSHYQTFANVYFLLFCLALARAAGAPPARAAFGRWAVAALLGVVVVFSFTRGIWLALLVALGIFAWTFARRAFLAFGAVAAVVVFAALVVPSSLRTRARSMGDPGTNVERLLLWETTWNMLRDRPLFGVGVGNYRGAQDAYVRDEVPMLMTRTHAHNVWLQAAAERGVLGLLALLWLMAAVCREAVGAVRRLRPGGGMPFALAAGGLAGITGFLLDGLVQNNLGDSQAALLFWIVAGVVLVAGGAAGAAPGPCPGEAAA